MLSLCATIHCQIFRGEHIRHRPDCELVKLNKPEEEYTVRDVLRLVAYVYSTRQVSSDCLLVLELIVV